MTLRSRKGAPLSDAAGVIGANFTMVTRIVCKDLRGEDDESDSTRVVFAQSRPSGKCGSVKERK